MATLKIEPPMTIPTSPYALSHLGFRPFFLLAGGMGLFGMALWTALYHQQLGGLPPAYPAQLWHAHEMVYGYALAVTAGFLLTAIKNWTGQQTLHQTPLLALAVLWLAARILPWLPGVPLWLAALADLLFLVWLQVAITQPIWRAKQWGQLAIIGKVALFIPANLLFYLGLLYNNPAWAALGLYAGFYLILALIFNMGRRVIPFFIERGVGCPFTATNRLWLDRLSLALFLLFAILDTLALAYGLAWARISAAWLALALAILHSLRLAGWHHPHIWQKPLLWVLFLAYGWIIAGFGVKAMELLVAVPPFLALHAFAVGGIGLMTVGMMARVTLGHTGRNVFAPSSAVVPLFILLFLSALVRVPLAWLSPAWYGLWILLAQWLWITAFALFLWQYTAMLMKPRVDGHYG